MVDSMGADVKYHDSFQLVDHNKKTPKRGGPRALAVAIDKSGKEWTNHFEWLSSFSIKVVKTWWDRAIAGTSIFPICHRAEKPWHVPANCPLLKDHNLKFKILDRCIRQSSGAFLEQKRSLHTCSLSRFTSVPYQPCC